jgi:hypothetical protein
MVAAHLGELDLAYGARLLEIGCGKRTSPRLISTSAKRTDGIAG